MSEFKLTAPRRALLQAVADGAVTEHHPLTGGAAYTLWDRGPGAKPHRWKRVTAAVWLLREHGLVTLPPRRLGDFSALLWTVTPAGQSLLDGES